MNYRHAFHAGNPGDVLKHVVLLALLDALRTKPSPFSVLDTHAGRGLYALDTDQAKRTGEAADGIGKLLGAAPGSPNQAGDGATRVRGDDGPLEHYLDAVRACRDRHGASAYPGSPWLIAEALRDGDRLACCELLVAESTALKSLFAADRRVAVHRRDGYEAMRALLPPTPRRGLVLIDPPYEAQLAEFDAVRAGLAAALERWPQGIYALWYPIKQRRDLQPFLRAASKLPVASAFTAELMVRPGDSPLRMNGSGMLVLNPPWRLDQALRPALQALGRALDQGGGSVDLQWLKRESRTGA